MLQKLLTQTWFVISFKVEMINNFFKSFLNSCCVLISIVMWILKTYIHIIVLKHITDLLEHFNGKYFWIVLLFDMVLFYIG